MSISFQLIELPENEQVTSRQVSLPDAGGTIGRSFECNIQLPDFARMLSRVHAEVMVHPEGGYQIVDRSVNGVYVNGVLLGKGASHRLNDGDNVRMGGYTLLFSDMNALFESNAPNSVPTMDSDAALESETTFDREKVLDPFNDVLIASDDAFSTPVEPTEVKATSTFSADNVTGEDLYGYDPFEDDEKWVMDTAKDDESEDIVMLEEDDPTDNGRGQLRALALTNAAQVEALESSIDRLNQVIEQQQQVILGSVDRDRLMASIESSLEKFLDELDPEKLEDEFDDYISGWGRKDRKYWQLYKKQFGRKKERRDFYRTFSALLFEELREKR